jgi:hypothetical protein
LTLTYLKQVNAAVEAGHPEELSRRVWAENTYQVLARHIMKAAHYLLTGSF